MDFQSVVDRLIDVLEVLRTPKFSCVRALGYSSEQTAGG
jgi:hypothetical protein